MNKQRGQESREVELTKPPAASRFIAYQRLWYLIRLKMVAGTIIAMPPAMPPLMPVVIRNVSIGRILRGVTLS